MGYQRKIIAALITGTILLIPHANASESIIPFDSAYVSRPGYMEVDFRDSNTFARESLAPSSTFSNYRAIFPPCQLKSASNCIEAIEYRKNQEDWQVGALEDYVPTGFDGQIDQRGSDGSIVYLNNFAENISKGQPGGGKASTWKLSGAPHALGDLYLASVYYESRGHFSVNLQPMRWGEEKLITYDGNEFRYRSPEVAKFPMDVEYKFKIRLGVTKQKLSTWMYGHGRDVKIQFAGDLLSISAFPGESSRAATDYFSCPNSITSEAIKRKLIFGTIDEKSCGFRVFNSKYDSNTFEAFKYFQPYLHQYSKEDAFSFDSDTFSGRMDSNYLAMTRCTSDAPMGFTTSNALVYENVIPTWDPVNNELSYKIGATHLNQNGDVNIGYFYVAMNENFAKCLWGLPTFEGVTGKIEITYEDPQSEVKLSTFERRNGWIYFSATGFHYSVPQFRIKLTKPVNLSISSTTLICIKGKKIITIKGKSPKCPTGYLKK